MIDPVLWVKDKRTKEKRLIRLLRFEKDPREMDQYFIRIPGEKPFENPNGGDQAPVIINVTTGDLVADAVMKGQQNPVKAGVGKKSEPEDDLEDEEDPSEEGGGNAEEDGEDNSPAKVPTREELEKLSYNDLRSLAKKQGIKIGPKLKVTQEDLVALLCGEKTLEDFESTT